MALVRTNDRHMPLPLSSGQAHGVIEEDDTTTMRVDNNNVDIDSEMAGLAKNQLYIKGWQQSWWFCREDEECHR